jgi:outer membrane protein assembly factor BamB
MPQREVLYLSIGILFLGILSPESRGEDWPQWGGHDGRNMVSPEKRLPSCFVPGKRNTGKGIDLATAKNVKWVARLGSETYGTPSIAGGKVFIGTNDANLDDHRYESTDGGMFRCLDEATGKLLWQLVVPCTDRHHDSRWLFDNMGLGICSAPAVDGDRVYLVTNRAEVLSLDINGMSNGNQGRKDEGQYSVQSGKPPVTPGAKDADIFWRFDMVAELPSQPHDAANCGVLVQGDLVYVCTSNGIAKGGRTVTHPHAPSLIALDKRTGRLVAADNEEIGTRLFHGQWSSPSAGQVNGRTLIFFGAGDGVCYAFEHAASPLPSHTVPLRKVWSFDCNPPEFRFKDGKPIDYWAGDVREHSGNAGDGSYIGPCEIIGTPAFYHGRVYVAIGQDPRHGRGRGILHCISAAGTGDITHTGRIWSYDKLDRSMSTVSIADGLLFIADYPGRIHCVDAETGHCYWVHETNAEIWGSTLVADGKLYVGTQKSFWVLAADKEKKVLSEVRLGSPVWASPVAANGTLYVTSQKWLWAVGCKK